MSTCGVLDRGERAAGELLGGLAAPGVDAGDDHVEAREELVGVVERRIGADLELGAVQHAERRELGVHPGDRVALLLHLRGAQAARDAERRRVVGEHDVLVARDRAPRAP